MRMLAFRFGGTGTQKWIVDGDTVLVAALSDKQFTVSNDPNLTTSVFNNPPLTSVLIDQLFLSNLSTIQYLNDLAFPLEKNQELYVSIVSVGTVQLFLEDSLL